MADGGTVHLRPILPSDADALLRFHESLSERTRYLRDAIAVADPSVNFAAYDFVYLVADPDAPGVDADATKVVNLATPMRAEPAVRPQAPHNRRQPGARAGPAAAATFPGGPPGSR